MKIFMKVFVVGLLSVFFSQSICASEYDVRKVKWGMSMAEVKSSESLPISYQTKESLQYKTSILNKDVTLVYQFVGGKLSSAYYISDELHTNKNDFITDYEDFKKTLTKKYGKSKIDKTVWKNNLYKDDYSGWGMAISLGHLVYLSSWETKDTVINNTLWGENFKITHIIGYESKKLEELKKKEKEKEALDAL